ncbi:hypothetical protein HUG10_04430 [Halorarum halophilum]|uniref:Cytochrome C oxidase subunit I n=1 Tax=Halorarum halophilum TaxID=2743090 RepID=A0A7D5GAQ9_9EURY|nr:DUF6789 family protein [Halobaculum halophilum]QLG26832.1 hypothetical protein HUG10_04430 [Halobaculum halophilum]
MSNSSETASETESGGNSSRNITPRKLVIAGGAGFVGILAMLPFFAVAYTFGALTPVAFASLSELVGISTTSPWAFPVGVILFVGAGMTMLPILFVSLAGFLPPERSLGLRGVAFATIVWTGFFFAFEIDQSGVTFWVFVVTTLLAHFAYGYVLGSLFGRYARVPSYDV